MPEKLETLIKSPNNMTIIESIKDLDKRLEALRRFL